MRIRAAVSLALLASFTLLSLVAIGATVKQMDVAALTAESVDVVIGTVSGMESYWAADRQQILTRITVDVSESFKGVSSGEIELSQIGGIIGDVRATAAGFPTFQEGAEVVLFLNDNRDGIIPTVGLGQGKYNVITDPQSGAKTVVNDLSGIELINHTGMVHADSQRMTLDELKDQIRTAIVNPQDNK